MNSLTKNDTNIIFIGCILFQLFNYLFCYNIIIDNKLIIQDSMKNLDDTFYFIYYCYYIFILIDDQITLYKKFKINFFFFLKFKYYFLIKT